MSLSAHQLGRRRSRSSSLLNLDYSRAARVRGRRGDRARRAHLRAAVYLVAERITRPALAYVLDPRSPLDARSLGVGAAHRPDLGAAQSGIPLIAIVLIPIGRVPDDPHDLIPPILFVVVDRARGRAARHEGGRPRDLAPGAHAARGDGRRRRGRHGRRGDVDDASEIGRLQAGFNADGRRAARARAAARPVRQAGRRRRRPRGARARRHARRRAAAPSRRCSST